MNHKIEWKLLLFLLHLGNWLHEAKLSHPHENRTEKYGHHDTTRKKKMGPDVCSIKKKAFRHSFFSFQFRDAVK